MIGKVTVTSSEPKFDPTLEPGYVERLIETNAALVAALEAAENYIRCQSDTSLSPYIRENGKRGGSPYSEFIDATKSARAALAFARTTDTTDGGK